MRLSEDSEWILTILAFYAYVRKGSIRAKSVENFVSLGCRLFKNIISQQLRLFKKIHEILHHQPLSYLQASASANDLRRHSF